MTAVDLGGGRVEIAYPMTLPAIDPENERLMEEAMTALREWLGAHAKCGQVTRYEHLEFGKPMLECICGSCFTLVREAIAGER